MPGRFSPRHRLQRKPLVSDPDLHHGTCVTYVPWCMSGSLTRGGGKNVPGIPGAWSTHNFTCLVKAPSQFESTNIANFNHFNQNNRNYQYTIEKFSSSSNQLLTCIYIYDTYNLECKIKVHGVSCITNIKLIIKVCIRQWCKKPWVVYETMRIY